MPSPDAARCRADMAAVARATHEILAAVAAVPPLLGHRTWHGSPADVWAADWTARGARLTALLHAVLAEQPRLIARVEAAEHRGLAS
ncbi:hypothetical protein Sru01_57170 [Sphaerisporangium rufum]|uniref:Uncharacterized protein n=1 Tax=Sphaerisporangium rufum TaxID=1381558 RepID=A0A919RB64_9ACTN|nr:hypothetical protein [Sphaerisporangium rufum]GII80735.1 hypothetical protein Sru01_57170 [Sphaerisporangium rufum]